MKSLSDYDVEKTMRVPKLQGGANELHSQSSFEMEEDSIVELF